GAHVHRQRDDVERLVRAALGLTLSEAENAFARAVANDDRLDADDIQLVLEEKRQVIRKSGLLEYYPTDQDLGGVGGLEYLKTWLDGGTGARVFGALLTWMQEKLAPVFVVATANNISELPPELLRKGRFDEIFFIDLPSASERTEIFAIHLKRRSRDPGRFDLGRLAELARGYSGAEIEQAIIAGLYAAFEERRDLAHG